MKKYLKTAYNLPWKYNDAPHAILDIIRGCNIKCNPTVKGNHIFEILM